ncbi:MAG: hypothetical protein GXP53_10265 [Deltaproteobacteria bacterium]|nr:hypothetical protein [Deltaproteobacteria bacterium]
MNTSRLETTDIFRGAFFLCMGGALSGVKFRRDGRKNASFLFTGPDLDRHDRDYMNGLARVNPLQLKESLNRLRDILFERLREKEGRYDSDRKRNHRGHQIRR